MSVKVRLITTAELSLRRNNHRGTYGRILPLEPILPDGNQNVHTAGDNAPSE